MSFVHKKTVTLLSLITFLSPLGRHSRKTLFYTFSLESMSKDLTHDEEALGFSVSFFRDMFPSLEFTTLSWKIAKGQLFERARLEEECLHFLLLLSVKILRNYAQWAICGKDVQGKE